jgi:asparagine synthetase B (glutamine-hydrolysing)
MLSPLELAAGVPLPAGRELRPVERSTLTPRAALEQAVLPAVVREPCVVSFSGGCDSSLVLAAAVDAARRRGLPLPIPLSIRVRDDAASDERRWQELVVRHLRLSEWITLEVGEELDCIGQLAQSVLLRHGVLWPANAHFHVPQLEHAVGGSLITGIGGDEIFGRSGWERLRLVLTRRARPRPRDALRFAAALAPLAVRAHVTARRAELELEWLQPTARRDVVAALARAVASEPVGWRRRFEWVLGDRPLQLGLESLDLLGRDYGTLMQHPLLDPAVVASLGSLPAHARFRDRNEALENLFPDLLPPALVSRRTKAVFSAPLWGEASRSFAAAWNGSGVDPEVVAVETLMRRWRVERMPGPYTLLQSLWLLSGRASAGDGREQLFNGLVEARP